jgi:hypothetical protein
VAGDAAYHVRFAVQTLVVARGQLRRARGARAPGVVEAHVAETELRLRLVAAALVQAKALAQGGLELDVVALRRSFVGLERGGEAVAVASGLQRSKGSRVLRAMLSTASARIAQAKASVRQLASRAWG